MSTYNDSFTGKFRSDAQDDFDRWQDREERREEEEVKKPQPTNNKPATSDMMKALADKFNRK